MTNDEAQGCVGCLVLAVLAVIAFGIFKLTTQVIVPWGDAMLDFRRAKKADTAEAYLGFLKEHPASRRASDAARRAFASAAPDQARQTMLRGLSILGEGGEERAVPLLAEYLAYPVTEIRVADAAALVRLAERDPQETAEALMAIEGALAQATTDPDPRVRGQASCLHWLATGKRAAAPQKETSSYVKAALETCVSDLERRKREQATK